MYTYIKLLQVPGVQAYGKKRFSELEPLDTIILVTISSYTVHGEFCKLSKVA